MKREKQPAKVSYFFGPGWKNLGEFTKIFWNLNRDDVRKIAARTATENIQD